MVPKIYPALDKPDKAGKTFPLYIYCNWNSLQDKFFTGERVAIPTDPDKPKAGEWHQKEQCIAGKTVHIRQQNANLTDRKNLLEKLHRNASLAGQVVSKEYLRGEYEKVYPPKRAKAPSSPTLTFFSAIPAYVEAKRGILSDGHLRKFRQLEYHMAEFSPELTFAQVTMQFYNDFLSYLINDAELSSNTIKHHIDCVRAVMRYALLNGVKVPPDFEHFKGLKSDAVRVYHTEEELALLRKYQTHAPGERRVVDIYLFSCYTSLRFSDIKALRPENIVGDVLSLVQHKGKNRNAIFLNNYAKEILKKYAGGQYCLPVISNVITNQHLKNACRKAGINQPVQHILYRGNNRVETYLAKWELVSFHSARHTFATISLKRGMKLEVLQEIMGHRDINTTRAYAKILSEEKHQAMRDIWNR